MWPLIGVVWRVRRRGGPVRSFGDLAVVGASVLVVFVVLGFGALQFAVQAPGRRNEARAPVAAASVERAEFLWSVTLDEINHIQYPVVFLEPLSDSIPLPPGVTSLPEEGGFVVSPELARMAADDPVVAARFGGRWETMGSEGLAMPRELFAYSVPPARYRTSPSTSGPAVLPAVGFGGPGAGILVVNEPPSGPAVHNGWFLVGLLPATVVLALSLRIHERERSRLDRVLALLGITRRRRTAAAVAGVTILVIPGAILGGLMALWAWPWVAGVVPPLTRTVYPGDLHISALQVVLAALVTWGLVVILVIAEVTPGVPTSAGPVARAAGADLGAAGRVYGLVVMGVVAALWAKGDLGGYIFAAALLVAVVALPLLLRAAISEAGRLLSGRGSPVALIAGRRLQHRTALGVRNALPFAVFVVVMAQFVVLDQRLGDNFSGSGHPLDTYGPLVALVSAEDLTSAAVADFRSRVGADEVLPWVKRGSRQVLVGGCEPLRSLGLDFSDCVGLNGENPLRSVAGGTPSPELMLLGTSGDWWVAPTAPSRGSPYDGLVVVNPRGWPGAADVRSAALATLYRPFVHVPGEEWLGGESQRRSLITWIGAGAVVLLVLATWAQMVSALDAQAARAPESRRLLRIGFTPSAVRRVLILETTMGLAVGLLTASGLAVALALGQVEVAGEGGLGTWSLLRVLAVAVTGTGLYTLAIGVLGIRRLPESWKSSGAAPRRGRPQQPSPTGRPS